MNLMMTEAQRMMLRTNGVLVARVLLGLLFLVAGYQKLAGGVPVFSGGIPEALPFPLLVAWLVVIIEIVAGAALIIGYRVGLAAGALAVFLLLTVVLVHNPFVNPEQTTAALKNLSILGGMLYIMAYGAGDGWRLVR